MILRAAALSALPARTARDQRAACAAAAGSSTRCHPALFGRRDPLRHVGPGVLCSICSALDQVAVTCANTRANPTAAWPDQCGVPRRVPCRCRGSEEIEQLVGVVRPVRGVTRGDAGEVIREAHGRARMPAARCTSESRAPYGVKLPVGTSYRNARCGSSSSEPRQSLGTCSAVTTKWRPSPVPF